MTSSANGRALFFALAAVSLAGGAGVYLSDQFVLTDALGALREAALYLLAASSTLVLSYVLFIKSSRKHSVDFAHSRR